MHPKTFWMESETHRCLCLCVRERDTQTERERERERERENMRDEEETFILCWLYSNYMRDEEETFILCWLYSNYLKCLNVLIAFDSCLMRTYAYINTHTSMFRKCHLYRMSHSTCVNEYSNVFKYSV